MPITLSFDIEQASVKDPNDRTRLELAFRRLGWEHIGGSSWRYPALGSSHASEDWLNHVVPALMYFRSLVVHAGLKVTKLSLDAHSEAGYRDTPSGPVGRPISAADTIDLYSPGLASNTEAILSESRLKKFIDDAAAERTRFKGGWCAEKGKAGAKATAKPGREGNPRG